MFERKVFKTMSKEKQIEEMAKVIDGSLMSVLGVRLNDEVLERLAEHHYNTGCRKQGEVVSEIITEIANRMERFTEVGYVSIPVCDLKRDLAEIRAKYTEGQNNQ